MATPARYNDGDILTAGSLNNSVNSRPNFVLFNAGLYTTTSSGTNVTVRDEYVTSGAISIINQIYLMANVQHDQSATAAQRTPSFRVAIGGSATSPTLTTIGSTAFTTSGVSDFGGAILMGVGSTTVDNSATPALVRISVGHEGTTTAQIQGITIYGV